MTSEQQGAREFRLLESELRPGCRAIKVEGELDLAVSDQLREALDRAAADHSEVLIELDECQFIDSTGIATIVRANNRMGERGGRVVVCGPTDQVRRVLSVTGLTDSGLVFDSVEAALAANDGNP